ncbi:MAG: hypothetical protein WA830_07180 [Candidatus Sulfotelmatobacter sp.]
MKPSVLPYAFMASFSDAYDRLSQQPFHSGQPLLEIRFLEHPELQVHQMGQSRRDPGVKLAGVDVGDRSGDDIADKSFVSDEHDVHFVKKSIYLKLRELFGFVS